MYVLLNLNYYYKMNIFQLNTAQYDVHVMSHKTASFRVIDIVSLPAIAMTFVNFRCVQVIFGLPRPFFKPLDFQRSVFFTDSLIFPLLHMRKPSLSDSLSSFL